MMRQFTVVRAYPGSRFRFVLDTELRERHRAYGWSYPIPLAELEDE